MDSGEDERNGTAGTKLANVTWSGQRRRHKGIENNAFYLKSSVRHRHQGRDTPAHPEMQGSHLLLGTPLGMCSSSEVPVTFAEFAHA